MIERYEKKIISAIWSDENKLHLWQETELAVIRAMLKLKKIPAEISVEIHKILVSNPIDADWWKERDNVIHHDLNAFLEERLRFLPKELHPYFHKRITSYDTEEPAFARMIHQSVDIVFRNGVELKKVLKELALKHRHVIMNGRTHGQEAELQTFGKRCLSWRRDIDLDLLNLGKSSENLYYSKLSGAIGNYGSIDPELEKVALKMLGFAPYYGATQIMPREIYAPVAQALCQIVMTLDKIATAIRLGARSGRPICQEPFSKLQKGSSAMPHKKNTIRTEQIEGMARMANGYLNMIMNNIKTWEERAIEQSCVERVAWPDLFHVTVHSLEVINKTLEGLKVYPDNMLWEIIESRGCYASGEAKEFLKEIGNSHGLDAEDAYRIVQLAAFNAFAVTYSSKKAREKLPNSLDETDRILKEFKNAPREKITSIEEIIPTGCLFAMPDQLDATEKIVSRWNEILKKIFSEPETLSEWHKRFQPSYLLRNEVMLYREIVA